MSPQTVSPTTLLSPWDSPGKNNGVGDLPNSGIEPGHLALQADSLLSEPPEKTLDFLIPHGKQGAGPLASALISLSV